MLLETKAPRFFLPPRPLIEFLTEEADVAVALSEELCWELFSSAEADSSSTLLSERRLLPEAADEDANIIFGSVIEEDMGDELKITVIATGFEKAHSATKDNIRQMAVQKEAQDIPTIIRNRWEQERMTKVAGPEDYETVEEEYDIPTFLRRQAE